MARRKRRTTVRRRKSNPGRKRRTTTKRKNPKRVAAGKKAARTRKRNASKRRSPARKRTTARRRRNPAKKKVSAGLRHYNALQKEAKRLGISAKGTTGQLEARIAQSKGLTKRSASSRKRKTTKRKTTKRRGRKMTRAGAARKGRATRKVRGKHARSARTVIRRNRGKKSREARAKRGVARTYMRARGISQRAKSRRMPAGAAKLAKAYGLTRVNPTGVKGAFKDMRAMFVPTILPATGGFVGAAVLGQMAGTKIAAMKWAQGLKSPAAKRAIVPLSTLGITLIAFAALKGAKGNAQRAAMPVLIGGGIATLVHTLLHTKMGQDLASKLKLPLALKDATDAQVEKGAEDGEKMANGETTGSVGGYMTVSQYLGGFTEVPVSKKGPSFYGRSDISPIGDYVDSGPQEAFGAYVASDFPVHTPGPGDNISVHASLMGLGAAYPPGGYDGLGSYNDPQLPDLDYSLEETPGGTIVMPMGEAGIFGGRSAIG